MTKEKFNWIAQDNDGDIAVYIRDTKPSKGDEEWLGGFGEHVFFANKTIKSWKKRCFDLSKFDYEIHDGKLIGIPKNAPDWLLKIKEINIKAFDLITRRKDIDKICESSALDAAFTWDMTKQGPEYWGKINKKLCEMEAENDTNKTKTCDC